VEKRSPRYTFKCQQIVIFLMEDYREHLFRAERTQMHGASSWCRCWRL